jgi:ribosomal-protein-alanine N-acetyltransferase
LSSTIKVEATIRPGVAGDISAVAAIEQDSFADPWSERSFEELLVSRAAIFLVATRPDSEIIFGYVIGYAVSDQAEILNLAVIGSARRHGIGGALLDAAIEAVSERGAPEIFLDVRESNKAALGLYRSRGFAEFGLRQRYYRNPVEDALVLRRAIER